VGILASLSTSILSMWTRWSRGTSNIAPLTQNLCEGRGQSEIVLVLGDLDDLDGLGVSELLADELGAQGVFFSADRHCVSFLSGVDDARYMLNLQSSYYPLWRKLSSPVSS